MRSAAASRFADGVQADFAFAALEDELSQVEAARAASEGAHVLGRAALLRLVLSQARTIQHLRKGLAVAREETAMAGNGDVDDDVREGVRKGLAVAREETAMAGNGDVDDDVRESGRGNIHIAATTAATTALERVQRELSSERCMRARQQSLGVLLALARDDGVRVLSDEEGETVTRDV